MGLLDQHGNPIKSSALLQEESAPSFIGTRQVVSNHPSRGLTPQRLAAILLEAEESDSTRYFELAEDMEEKDLHYLGVLGTRKRAVAQLEVTVEAASDHADDIRIADDVRTLLNRDTLQQELFDILDAIGKGVSCSEILWRRDARKWTPREFKHRDPRFFEFSREDGETLLRREGAQLLPLTPFKYIVHIAKAKSGIPIRGGLARPVSWCWLFKNFSLKDWVAFGEVFGQPYRIGKYQSNATKEDKSALLRAVANVGSDAAAIIPESMIIEFVEAAKSGSVDVYDRITRFLDEQVSKAVLGQTTTTEVTQGGGSRALGQVHDEVRGDIRDADAIQLTATLNRDLIRPYVDLNYGPREAYPRLVLGRADELPLEKRLELTGKFVEQGLDVAISEVRDRLGWGEPEKGKPILVAAKPAPVGTPTPVGTRPIETPVPPTRRTHQLQAAINSTAGDAPVDAIDLLVRNTLEREEWVPVMKTVVNPLRAIVDEATSLEQLRDRVTSLIGAMDVTELTTFIERAGFAARMAGELEIPLAEVAG